MSRFRISYHADEDSEDRETNPVLDLRQKLDNLKRAIDNASYELRRRNNRRSALIHLLEVQTTALRQMKKEPSVSMAQFQHCKERIAQVERDLKIVRDEAKELSASIDHGQKALEETNQQILALSDTPSANRVVKLRRPGDERP